jgi:outer membrane protein assembly factor BamA
VIRAALALLVGLCAAAPQAAAQLLHILPRNTRWVDVGYPKLFWIPREGVTAGGYYGIIRPQAYSDFESAAPVEALVSLDGQISASGSRFIALDAWAPNLVKGWRFHLTVAAKHWNREPYFGIGNATTADSSSIAGADEFYRMRRIRNYVRGEVQRRVVGRLRVLVGWHAEHYFLDTLAARSQFAYDRAAGANPRIGVGTNDVSVRVGLVYDTRDREAAPQRGVLLEAIQGFADADILGDLTYQRTTLSARAFLPLTERWGLAGRIAGETMGGTPGLDSYFEMEASDRPFGVLGGPDSHRALYRNRFLGADKLLGNLEVRYVVLPYGLRTVAFGFLDAGRVFGPGDFTLTTDGLKVGGGLGAMIQLLSETALIGPSLGIGPDGLTFQLHWRWTF